MILRNIRVRQLGTTERTMFQIMNFPLKRSNQGYGCSMGNYCVTEAYNLKVKNVTNKDKYFEYVAETSSNIAVYVEDENGKHSGLLKDESSPAKKDTMASVLIPANSERHLRLIWYYL